MGFCMGFLLTQSDGNKSKNPLSLAGQRVSVELLGGFEPPTSSLPIQERLFSPIAAYCILLPGALAPQWIGPLVCCILLYSPDNFFILFFGARMGFVWVSSRTHTARPHPFICSFSLAGCQNLWYSERGAAEL